MITLLEEDIYFGIAESTGVCVSCGALGQFAEPDAAKYICEECGEPAVYGMEQAIVEMLVEVE